jgi:hypothetical protein
MRWKEFEERQAARARAAYRYEEARHDREGRREQRRVEYEGRREERRSLWALRDEERRRHRLAWREAEPGLPRPRR